MISNFTDAAYLILGRPHLRSCFFKKTQFQRLLYHNLLQVPSFAAQNFDLLSGRFISELLGYGYG